ncbi:DUF6427 family protein [uncultured Flavobacterium sp.]|uniref:DUF6427 family protein n=1 Tax=uncultured Flavobacterium sp. TaxID=165435 RepID=UPI0030EE65EB|tara:strand:+ start:536 stop:1465 length:930 start_codon:yes stop_codon:yes gene_type:complete
MIASVFSKTRPINYLILGIITLFLYGLYQFKETSWTNDGWQIAQKIGLFLFLFASYLLLNFLTLKNNLTKSNNYTILLFSIFLFLFPLIFKTPNVIIANFLLLLALRRLISLQNLKNTKEKIFDASFWIFVATLFHFWCISFIILVFISIIFHVSGNYKNWIIPILALFAVAILSVLVDLILDNNLISDLYSEINTSFNFSYFENIYQNIALAVFSSVALLFFSTQITEVQNKPLNQQSTYKKILFAFLLGVLIYVLSDHKNNSYLIFSLAPLAILGANFIETIKTNWMKETTLYLLVFVSITMFLLQL